MRESWRSKPRLNSLEGAGGEGVFIKFAVAGDGFGGDVGVGVGFEEACAGLASDVGVALA